MPVSSQQGFTLRRAKFSDLSAAARTCSLAFWDDVLFGRLIHPHRASYPFDFDKYWYRRFVVDWWDRSHVFLITTDTVHEGSKDDATGREVVTGLAHWSRIAPARQVNYDAGWELRWWDPRRLLKPLSSLLFRFVSVFSPNRAASPTLEPIIEQSYHYLDHIWTGPRAESWYLECLAVHPKYQSHGHGRALVSWGMDQARKEGIACSVIAAEGKERFYERCGYDSGPVGRGGEGDGNPLREVEGGIVFFKDKVDVKVKARHPGDWTYGPGLFQWDAWTQGLNSRDESAGDVEGGEDWKSEEGSPWVWRDL